MCLSKYLVVWLELEPADLYKDCYKPLSQVLSCHTHVFSSDYVNVPQMANLGDAELRKHVELVLRSLIKLRPEDVITQSKTFYGIYEFLEYITRNTDLGLIFLSIPYDRANLLLELLIEAAQSFEVKTCLLAYTTCNNIASLLLRKSPHSFKEELIMGYLTQCQDQLRRLLRTLFSLIVQAQAKHYVSIAPGLFGLVCCFQADFQEMITQFLGTHMNLKHAEEGLCVLMNGVVMVSSIEPEAREKNYYQTRLFTSNVERFIEHMKKAN